MARYIMLTRVTGKGAEKIKLNPGRIEAVSKELEKFGVKVVAQYAVLGPFDFVKVLEAPDNITIARLSAELASQGTVRIQTLPAGPRSRRRWGSDPSATDVRCPAAAATGVGRGVACVQSPSLRGCGMVSVAEACANDWHTPAAAVA
jgi:uncharacterized protein with GYD domain